MQAQLDRRLHVGEQVAARAGAAPREEPADEVDDALAEIGVVLGDGAVQQPVGDRAQERRDEGGEPGAGRDGGRRAGADDVDVRAQQDLRHREDEHLERVRRRHAVGPRGVHADEVAGTQHGVAVRLVQLLRPGEQERQLELLGVVGGDGAPGALHPVPVGGDPPDADRAELVLPRPAAEGPVLRRADVE